MKQFTILLAFASLCLTFCKSETKDATFAESSTTQVPSGSLEAKSVVIDTTFVANLSKTIAKLNALPAGVAKKHKEEMEQHQAYLNGIQTKVNDARLSLAEWRDQIYRIGIQQKEGKISLSQASRTVDSLNTLISNFSAGYDRLNESVRQIDQQVSGWK